MPFNFPKKIYNLGLYIIIILFFSIGIILMLQVFHSYTVSKQKVENYNYTYIDTKYISVIDLYDSEGMPTLSEAMSKGSFLDKNKKMNEELHTSNKWVYFEVSEQPVEYFGYYNGKNNFVEGFKMDNSMKNQKIRLSNKDTYVTPLKAIQLDNNAAELFNLNDSLFKGNVFAQEDFNYYYEKDLIPVLLGNEYVGIYKIGDCFNINYLNKNIRLKTIGFLKPNISIPLNYDIKYLDDCIIMPSIIYNENPKNEKELQFQNMLYSQKNWGYIVNENKIDYADNIENLAEKYNLAYSVVSSDMKSNVVNNATTSNLMIAILTIISCILILIASAIMILVLIRKVNQNAKLYAIHLICGASLNNIKNKIFAGIIVCFIISTLLAILLYSVLAYIPSNTILLIVVSITISLTAIIVGIINYYINHYDICRSLRRK